MCEVDDVEVRDRKWLKRIADNRDRSAMDALYLAYKARLIPFLFRLTTDAELVEEVYNDVMFKVWRKAAQFRAEAKVSSWIFAIGHRDCVRLLKREQRRRRHLPTQRDEEPNEALDEREVAYRPLRNAVAALPVKQRLTVELYYFADATVDEIAQITRTPRNTVKTRLHHARNALQRQLSAIGETACD